MKNVIKAILIFAAGAGAGCAGSYFFLKKKFDKELIDELDRIKDMPESKEEPEEADYIQEVPDPEDFIEVKQPTGIPSYAQKNVTVTDYSKMAVKGNIDIPSDVDVTDIMDIEPSERPIAHLISVEKYEELTCDHKQENLLYYSDGTITDDFDNIWYRSLDQLIPNASEEDFDEDGYLYAERIDPGQEPVVYEVSRQFMSYNEATGKE